jgi:drug/metabolite transporter (DMT)-like permease
VFQSHIGEFAALLTALFWTFSAIAFTSAGKRIGSLSVNIWRLIVGLAFIILFTFLAYGSPIPLDISPKSWIWLSLSGFVGVFLGDLFLFKSYTIIGPRISLLVMSLAPPLAALISWVALGESLTTMGFMGMTVTLAGICLVVLMRKKGADEEKKSFKLRYHPRGIFFAFLGAIGQASGLVMSKVGLSTTTNPFYGSEIRLFAGLFGFILLITYLKRWPSIFQSVKNPMAMGMVSIGGFFGPFVGITLSLFAVQHANPGVVQTIVSINPVLIIPFAMWLYHDKITLREALGALVAVVGVSLFFV